jgi:hypothetical protein
VTSATAQAGKLAGWPTRSLANSQTLGPWLRLASFIGLAGLGSAYWASFVDTAPTGRVMAVLLIATALGAGLIVLRGLGLPNWATHATAALATVASTRACWSLPAGTTSPS